MHKRDHNWEDDFHHEGDGYTMVVRKPGAHRILIPAGYNFVDVYLGRSMTNYKIAGVETLSPNTPPSTYVFLPANGEREIHAVRSGWSVQMIFGTDDLTQMLQSIFEMRDTKPSAWTAHAIHHAEDASMVGIAQAIAGVWRKRLALPDRDQLDAAARLLVMRLAYNLTVVAHVNLRAKNQNASRFQAVLDHIAQNLPDRMSLDELASIANLSPYHFARVFRDTMGHSPHQYIKLQRVAVAKQMLKRSDEPIAAIAYDCGFSSQSHMTDVFKKTLGVTPGILRKNRE
ncbi:AraC family transcriptional regulator [uncultured Tateyamaria sp.]|uniref:AraC family transcriptional regulator n=1 Tax=uncultured Tateyamaria sp. TaxID=455651 RepID=UPI00262A3278|nr:AraC family transcriptional regulator [uncultured Tateyamaria sp.]